MNKRTFLILSSSALLSVFLVTSCVKDKGKLPEPPPQVDNCDTVTWEKHIKSIIETMCSTTPGCHTGGAPSGATSLDTYEQVKNKATEGRIKARVIDGNPGFMPPSPNPPLTNEQKSLIQCWLDNGQKEN